MTKKAPKKPTGPGVLIERPMTPAVAAIARLNITGNVTPHVWYLRSEFRTPAGRPNRNMITAVADILYWYKPQEVRDEEQGGMFVGYARKFQRDMLQYDYERRAAIFGMSKREMQEACTLAAKRGLIKIEYRTEKYRGTLLHNIVYVEPVAEAIAATLSGADVEPVMKAKGATRGRHLKAPSEDEGIDDQIPEGQEEEGNELRTPSDIDESTSEFEATSQNFGELDQEAENPTSQNFGTSTSQNFEGPAPKFWDTYHESSDETSFSRDFERGGALDITGNPRAQEEQPVPPVAVLDQPERTTSGKAAPPTASVAQTADGPLGAGAPDGATSEALDVSDDDLKVLFGRQNDNAPAVEQVPGGAAAAEAARLRGIDDLLAVPEAELLERPQAAVNGPAYKAIMALVGGAAKLELLLGEETRSGGYGRERWLRLNLDEVEQVKITAQAQARQPGTDGKRVPFSTLSILGLDRLIGAPKLTPGTQKAALPAGPYGNATKVAAPGQKLTAPPEEPYTGSTMVGRWALKANAGTVIEVVEMRDIEVQGVKQARAVLSDGSMLSIADLVVKHNQLHVGR